MNSTQQKPKKSRKITLFRGNVHVLQAAPHRKNRLHVEEKTEVEEKSSIVRNYNEAYLFHLYCTVGGKIPELLELVKRFPEHERESIPKQSTLYKIAAENYWRDRFLEIRLRMREEFEKRNGLAFTKIDELASYVLQGTLMRAMTALNEENFADFNMRDLKMIWTMHRTERGLAQGVPYRDQNQERYGEQIRRLQANQREKDLPYGEDLMKRFDALTPEESKKFEWLLTGKDPDEKDGIPSMIRKN